MLERLLSQQTVEVIGWTLLHFIWQGALIAVLLATALRLLRKASANARYLAACSAMIFFVVSAAATMYMVAPAKADVAVHVEFVEPMSEPTAAAIIEETPRLSSAEDAEPVTAPTKPVVVPLKERMVAWLESTLPHAVLVWIVGVLLLSVWHLGGWAQLQRMRRRLTKPVSDAVQDRARRLAELIGLRRAVELTESALVRVPTVVGWLKPVILLPASALTGLSAEQLEAILAHELAHIRRHDYLVNMLQTVIEIVGFYHPAVWWVSHRIRVERENCCDDIAVRVCGDGLGYAKALTAIEELRSNSHRLAVAASGGSLFDRVRRLIGSDLHDQNLSARAPALIAVLLVLALAVPVTIALTSEADEIPEGLAGKVIEGFRANRDKFKCGILAWTRMTMDDGFTKPVRPKVELKGEYELWWDGEKIATKYVQEQTNRDPTGRFWIDKERGGSSYDGSALSRKPRFYDYENWLESVIRWRGMGSHDQRILMANKLDYAERDWSVIDVNGVNLVRFKLTNKREGDSGYGAYSAWFYDPSKGYDLVKMELWNSDGRVYGRNTVKLQEVIPGGWFPVEVDYKSFSTQNGKVTLHQHYELDMKRCSFNDRTAIPKGIFKWTTDKRLKEQVRLEELLEGFSDVNEIEQDDAIRRASRKAIEAFVTAALAGNIEEAKEYKHPDRLPADHINDVYEQATGQDFQIMAVYADDWSAMAIGSVITAEQGQVGPIVFYLDRVVLDGKENWWVHDIDFAKIDKAERKLKQFLQKYPKAKRVPELPSEQTVYSLKCVIEKASWNNTISGYVVVRLQNVGDKDIAIPIVPQLFEIEFDGDRFVHRSWQEIRAKSTTISPGTDVKVPALSLGDYIRFEDRMEGNAAARPLSALKPGRYSVRASYVNFGPNQKIHSNIAELEIPQYETENPHLGWYEYLAAAEFLHTGGDRRIAAKQFESTARKYPDSRSAKDCEELGRMLLEMAQEAEKFVKPKDIESLSTEDKIEYLMYKLRDVSAREPFVPGKCSVLRYGRNRDNAAVALRKMGSVVVPAMIGILEDRRPTRSVGLAKNGGVVLRYCDIALEILADIAGVNQPNETTTFDPRTERGAYLSSADEQTRRQIIARVEQWWQKEQSGTEAETTWGEAVDSLQCRLLPQAQIAGPTERRGGGAHLSYEIRNLGERAVTFLNWNTPLGRSSGDIFSFAPTGKVANYIGKHVDLGTPGPNDFVLISPGQTLSKFFSLPYDISSPGKYEVSLSTDLPSTVLESYYQGDTERMKQNPDNVWAGRLVSNTITIEYRQFPPKIWKETTDQVHVKLTPQRKVWTIDEHPILEVEIHNVGDEELPPLPYPQSWALTLKIDSQWLTPFFSRVRDWPDHFLPGQKHTIQIDLSHYLASPDVEPLAEGKHVMRVGFQYDQKRGREAISNPVEIEILPRKGTTMSLLNARQMGAIEFIDKLKMMEVETYEIIGMPQVKQEYLAGLFELLDSDQKCSSVVSFPSSPTVGMGVPSTVGREAGFLIRSFIRKQPYPPPIRATLSEEDKAELRQWWNQNKSVRATDGPSSFVSGDFGSLPWVYRNVYDCAKGRGCYIDFDRGILFSTDHFPEVNDEALGKWLRQKGIDAGVKWSESGKLALFGIDLETMKVAGRSSARYFSSEGAQKDVPIEYSGRYVEYYFRTREGGTGFLELINQSRDSSGDYLRIRYETPSMKGVVLSGRVLTEPGGKGVEGIRLVLQGPGLYATTDAEGRYRFAPYEADSRSRPMNIWIVEEAQALGAWRPGIRVDVADKDIRLEDIHLALPQSIRGTVRNAKTGEPVGAGVRIQNNNSSVPMRSLRTDENGNYCFYVSPGSYKLVCMGSEDRYYGAYDSESREGKIRTVSVKSGQVVEGIDLEVDEAQAYSGVVELPDGQAAAGAEVFVHAQWFPGPNDSSGWFYDHSGPQHMQVALQTDIQGRFVGYLRRPPMPEREEDEIINIVAVARSGGDSMSGFTTIKTTESQGVTDPMRIVLFSSGSIAFRLVGPDGRGIDKALVRGNADFEIEMWSSNNAEHLRGLTEDLGDGDYTVTGLLPGVKYKFDFYAKRSYLSGKSDWFMVEPGELIDLGSFTLQSPVARKR